MSTDFGARILWPVARAVTSGSGLWVSSGFGFGFRVLGFRDCVWGLGLRGVEPCRVENFVPSPLGRNGLKIEDRLRL